MAPVELNLGGKTGYVAAVLLSWHETFPTSYVDVFTQVGLYYCQNKLVEQTFKYRRDPMNNTEELIESNLNIVAEYCVIPEADDILNDVG